jgi:hypothetical protein
MDGEWGPNRIFAINHTENGKRLHSEVGKPHPENGETVIAIFTALGGPFLVCTPSRGVVSGPAMLSCHPHDPFRDLTGSDAGIKDVWDVRLVSGFSCSIAPNPSAKSDPSP